MVTGEAAGGALLVGGIAYLVFCALIADIGWRKGRGWFAGFLLSLFFTPISGVIVLGLLSKPVNVPAADVRVPCPQCKESILVDAALCRFCHTRLSWQENTPSIR